MPLMPLIDYILKAPSPEDIANEVEKERPDLYLYRRIYSDIPSEIWINFFQLPGPSYVEVAQQMLLGLAHHSLDIRTTCYALIARIDYRIAETMVCSNAFCAEDFVQAFQNLLFQETDTNNLVVGTHEKAALLFLAHCAVQNFNDAIYRLAHAGRRANQDSDAILSKYRQLEHLLCSMEPGWTPGKVLSAKMIAKERPRNATGLLIPGSAYSYLLRITMGLDAITKLHWNIRYPQKSVGSVQCSELLVQTRSLVQTAWLTVRQQRRCKWESQHSLVERRSADSELYERSRNDLLSLKVREQAFLARLSILESDLYNHVRAAIYAVSALQLLRNCQTEKNRMLASCRDETDRRRLDNWWHGILSGHSSYDIERLKYLARKCSLYVPCVNGEVRVNNPPIIDDKQLRLQNFRRTFQNGDIVTAAKIAAPGPRYNQETLLLSKHDLLQFAEALWKIYWEALPFVDYDTYQPLRVALRRLWKTWAHFSHLNPDKRESLTFGETLLIHDIKRGVYHSSVQDHDKRETIIWGTYNQLDDAKRELLYEEFAEHVATSLSRQSHVDDITNGDLDIPNDTVFISLCIRDGHEINIAAAATKNTQENPFTVTTADVDGKFNSDIHWSALAKKMTRTHEMWSIRKKGQRDINPIPWDKNFVELGKTICRTAFKINCHVKCIAFASDSILRGLPWQYLFSIVLRNYIQRIRKISLVQRGTYSGAGQLPGLLIRHVEGALHFAQSKRTVQRPKPGVMTEVDRGEPRFKKAADVLKSNRVGIEDVSLLTVLKHGKRNNVISKIIQGGIELTDEEHRALSGHAVSLLHSCHTGYIADNPIGDFGALPGFFISHGSELVIAPVAAVSVDAARRFDGHITAWLRDTKKEFIASYLTAILEAKEFSLYSVYGDPHKIDAIKGT